MNKCLKEIQENVTKQIEAFEEKTNKYLRGTQEKTIKQVKETTFLCLKNGNRSNKENTN